MYIIEEGIFNRKLLPPSLHSINSEMQILEKRDYKNKHLFLIQTVLFTLDRMC